MKKHVILSAIFIAITTVALNCDRIGYSVSVGAIFTLTGLAMGLCVVRGESQ